LLPPAWQAAQLALNIFAPAAASPAQAGVVKAMKTREIAIAKIEINFFKVVLLYNSTVKQR
jgi:hypothetical protein